MTQIFTDKQEELLRAPLDATQIKTRPGGRGLLKYIKGDTAIDAANRIFGYGKWGYKVIARSHELIQDEKKGTIEFYTADIELYVVGAAFPFPGDGVGIVNAPYTVEIHEKARKEAATDALKRALRHYGDQFGLSLYDEDDYVELNGELVQVKAINPNQIKQQHPPRRVVEAPRAAQQQQIAAPTNRTAMNKAQPVESTSNRQNANTSKSQREPNLSEQSAQRPNGYQETQTPSPDSLASIGTAIAAPSAVERVKDGFVEVYGVAEDDIEVRWPKYKKHILGQFVDDPDLTLAQIAMLNGDVVAQRKKVASKAS